jgi:hypothetical protein
VITRLEVQDRPFPADEEPRMNKQKLYGVLTGVLILVLVSVLVVGVTVKVRADRSARAEVDLLTIAQRVELPPGSRPDKRKNTYCFTSQYVRCALVDRDTDEVARQMQALVTVAADEEADLDCQSGASKSVRSRMCTIRIDRDQRVLLVSVTSNLELVDGKIALDGTQIRISKP